MLEWIKFIGEFIASMFHGIVELLTLFADSIGTLSAASVFAPSFLRPILTLSIAVAIVMWVVNLF